MGQKGISVAKLINIMQTGSKGMGGVLSSRAGSAWPGPPDPRGGDVTGEEVWHFLRPVGP